MNEEKYHEIMTNIKDRKPIDISNLDVDNAILDFIYGSKCSVFIITSTKFAMHQLQTIFRKCLISNGMESYKDRFDAMVGMGYVERNSTLFIFGNSVKNTINFDYGVKGFHNPYIHFHVQGDGKVTIKGSGVYAPT